MKFARFPHTAYFPASRLALAGLLLAGSGAQAQTPGSGGPVPGATPPAPTSIPLDGGASLLLAAGAGLGLRALRRRAHRS
ncbi:hypothetical protein GCM10027048_37640 [Hymenobacter coalescens]